LARELSGPRAEGGLTSVSEYLPRSVGDLRKNYEGTLETIKQTVAQGPRSSPGITVQSFAQSGSSSESRIGVDLPGEVVLPIIYYDFYRAHLRSRGDIPIRDNRGFVAFSLPVGEHLVVVSERITAIQWLALGLSLLSTLIYLRLLFENASRGSRRFPNVCGELNTTSGAARPPRVNLG
jgi:hypothetical protein